jgi:hypothetical protein
MSAQARLGLLHAALTEVVDRAERMRLEQPEYAALAARCELAARQIRVIAECRSLEMGAVIARPVALRQHGRA